MLHEDQVVHFADDDLADEPLHTSYHRHSASSERPSRGSAGARARGRGRACTRCCGVSLGVAWPVLFVLGAAMVVVFGVVLPGLLQARIRRGILQQYVPDGPYDASNSDWLDFLYNDRGGIQPTKYLTFWLYNVTNADEVLYGGAWPSVDEVGPFVYVYHEHRLEPVLERRVEEDGVRTVSFVRRIFYTPDMNEVDIEVPGQPDTHWESLDPNKVRLTMFDPVLFGAAYQVRHNPTFSKGAAAIIADACALAQLDELECFNLAVDGEGGNLLELLHGSLVATRTATEWLGFNSSATPNNTLLAFVNEKLKGHKDSDNKFGLFYNSTQDSDEDALTHVRRNRLFFDRDHVDMAQSFVEWRGNAVLRDVKQTAPVNSTADATPNILNDQSKFMGWGTPTVLRGYHSSTHIHPDLFDPNEQLELWLAAGARPVKFIFGESVVQRGDVDASRYYVSPDNWGGSEISYEKYFTPKDFHGLSNQANIHSYAPLWASPARYAGYYDDIMSKWTINNMPLPTEEHITYLDIEPNTGLTISAAERLQINILIPVHDYKWSKAKLPFFNRTDPARKNMLLPLTRFSKRSELNSADADKLKRIQLGKTLIDVSYALGAGLFGGGLVLASVAIFFLHKSRTAEDARARQRDTTRQLHDPVL